MPGRGAVTFIISVNLPAPKMCLIYAHFVDLTKLSFETAKYTVQSDTHISPADALLAPKPGTLPAVSPLLSTLSQSSRQSEPLPLPNTPVSPQPMSANITICQCGQNSTLRRRFSTPRSHALPSNSIHHFTQEAPCSCSKSVEAGTCLYKFISHPPSQAKQPTHC